MKSTWAAILIAGLLTGVVKAADRVTLSANSIAEYALNGPEVDAIYGDTVLRNNHLIAVVANPDRTPGLSSSRRLSPAIAGCVIDLTQRNHQDDRLIAFRPGPPRLILAPPGHRADFPNESTHWNTAGQTDDHGDSVTFAPPTYEQESGRTLVELAQNASRLQQNPSLTCAVVYRLADNDPYLTIETTYHNPTHHPLAAHLHSEMHVDSASERGRDADRRLLWTYDRWSGRAYGVVAINHEFDDELRPVVRQVNRPLVKPGESLTVGQKLIPGGNLFDVRSVVNALDGISGVAVTFIVVDRNGPVVDAEVRIRRYTRLYGAGRTGNDGRISVSLPIGGYQLDVTATGRPTVTRVITLEGPTSVEVEMASIGIVELTATDAHRNALPCKVAFRGRNETPDPVLAAKNGIDRVGNLVYTHTGTVTQSLLPGDYTVVVSRGPEYEIFTRDITVQPDEVVALSPVLDRAVDTTGWISADFHSHSTRSVGVGHVANANPSTRHNARQRGRVLNLLCEHIEFAPATEHNVISSFAPHLDALGMTAYMATSDGIGFTADHHLANVHANLFPATVKPWHLDGGAKQRPLGVAQLEWLHDEWLSDGANPSCIQLIQPDGISIRPTRAMDTLDVQSLEPLLTGRLQPGTQSSVLHWIQLLNDGYRISGVLNSGAWHNFHGSGMVRNYVRSATDDPSKIDPIAIAAAAANGHVVMSTGPFMRVTLHPMDNPNHRVGPGDAIQVANGQTVLTVQIQAPSWISIDEVQVFVNGTAASRLRFQRARHSHKFGQAIVQFDNEIPVFLNEDSHLIVAAKGSGTNLVADWRQRPRNAHFVVANPIFVDVRDDGYRPHSPLDDKVKTRIEWMRPVLAAPNSPPGRVRVHLHNTGRQTAKDIVTLVVEPEQAGRFVSIEELFYDVAPGATTTADFELQLSPAFLDDGLPIIPVTDRGQYLRVRVPRSANGMGHTMASAPVAVDHPGEQIHPPERIFDVNKSLRDISPYPFYSRDQSRALGTIRFAVAGDQLALFANVDDQRVTRNPERPWTTSCIEVFGAAGQHGPIHRIMLLPRVEREQAIACQLRDHAIQPQPDVSVLSRPTDTGYQLSALIPLALLPIDVGSGRIALEFRVSAAQDNRGSFARGTVFWSTNPEDDARRYGRIRLRDRVNVTFDIEDIVINDPDVSPGTVHMTLHNHSTQHAADTAIIQVQPDGAGIVQPNAVPFSLGPGEERTVALTVASSGFPIGALTLVIPRSPLGDILRSPGFPVRLHGRALSDVETVPTIQAVSRTLAHLPVGTIYQETTPVATVRYAYAERRIIVYAIVNDDIDTSGKGGRCIELFGARPGGRTIGHVVLFPNIGDSPAAAYRHMNGTPTAAPTITVASTPTDSGYTLSAIVPDKSLAFNLEDDEEILLEMSVTTAEREANGPTTLFQRATLFGSRHPDRDNRSFAVLSVEY